MEQFNDRIKASAIFRCFFKNLYQIPFLIALILILPHESNAFIKKSEGIKDSTKVQIQETYGKLPLYFIQNDGQLDEKVKYYEKGNSHSTFFTNEGVYIDLVTVKKPAQPVTISKKLSSDQINDEKLINYKSEIVRLSFKNAKPSHEIIAEDPQEGKVNYFIGNDSQKKWRDNISTYRAVVYKEIYPGIDIKFYGNNQQLEYDIIVKPGANPSKVQFAYEGIAGLKITEEGNLVIDLKEGTVIQKKPKIYQEINGKRVQVEGRFKILSFADKTASGIVSPSTPTDSNDTVSSSSKNTQYLYSFEVASYDRDHPLVIDPILVYSTYLGGNWDDYGGDIAVDAAGNAYVMGWASSANFPATPGAYDTSHNGGYWDEFIVKLDTSGSSLVYATYLGGNGYDYGNGIAVDASGNLYITGATYSTDFPTTNGAYDTTRNGSGDVFIVKLNQNGSALLYSTLVGGSNNDDGGGIALDASGNAYITGQTSSSDFPTTVGAYDTTYNGSRDAFVVKLDAAGSALSYSTYLGGSNWDYGRGIAVDSFGNAYVTGETSSSNFPTTSGAYDTAFNGGPYDGFVVKLDASGSVLSDSTYIGGSNYDGGAKIALDASGNAYVIGRTESTDFPTTSGAYDTTLNGGSDVFVMKLGFPIPAEGTFTPTGNMTNARRGHTATLLQDGRVLITGGIINIGSTRSSVDPATGYLTQTVFSSAEIYDPATGYFTPTGTMSTARFNHTATLLANGTVLIVGGYNGTSFNKSSEIYDPSSGTFSETGSLGTARYGHTATPLNDGTVLIIGGTITGPAVYSSAEIYNPDTGIFEYTGSMSAPRAGHTTTLLDNGMVLVTGGSDYYNTLSSAELYDPSTKTFTNTGSMTDSRFNHSATLLQNGKVLIAGGHYNLSSAELYDPATGLITTTGSLNNARAVQRAVMLYNGEVLLVGGNYHSSVWEPLNSAELYNSTTGTFNMTGNMSSARAENTVTLLKNGLVLITGGYSGNNGVNILSTAELYTPVYADADSDTDGYSSDIDCDDNDPNIHPNATELCNNINDDCDSQTDEDFPNLNTVCSAGTGPCVGSGNYVCNATAGLPFPEVCDGIDNDCDEVVDNNCGELVVGPFTITADIIQFQENGKYLASGNVRLNEFLHMPDNLFIDLSDPQNPWIEGNGVVSIGLPGPEMAIFAGAFYLDAETQRLRPQAGIILEPRLSIAGFEISIDEIEIVADIAPDSDPQNDAGVIINGSFALPTIFWKSQNDKIDISFKGGLSIGILSGLHFSYGFQIEGLKLGNTGWELKDLYFFYNTATDTIEAETELKLPVFGIEATLALKGGALDSIILDVDLSRLPAPIVIDSLPLILSRIAGGVENIQGPDPIQIRAGTGVQTYPRAPITNCDGEFNSLIGVALEPMDAIIDLGGKFTLTGDTYIFKPLNTWECDLGPINITYDGYHLAQAEGSIDWIKEIGKAKGDLNFFDILIAIMQMSVQKGIDQNAIINGSATGKIQIPRWALCIGGICAGIPGGQTIASNAIYLDNNSIRTEVSIGKLIVTVQFNSNGKIDWGVNWKDLFKLKFAEYQTDLRMAALGDSVPTSGGTNQILLPIAQPSDDMVIRLAWSNGDTDFDLITPSGRKLTPIDNPELYFKNQDIHEAFYLINNPEAGDWKAIVYNTDIIGPYEIEVLGRNMPPSITLMTPLEDMIKPIMVDILWQDEDPDDNATVSLYYDDDNQGVDGVQIVGDISEDNETDSYSWDTTDVPTGIYYIYAKIDDGNNALRFAYSIGKVTVERTGAPSPPQNLQTIPGDGQINLSWDASLNGTVLGYRVYYTDNITEDTYEHSLAVGNATQAELKGLANGRSYRVAVTAYDAMGRESLPSVPQVVSLISATSNNIPLIISDPILSVREYHPYLYDVEAIDADNDNLRYSLVAAPENMTIDPVTGLIEWTPTRAHAGNNYVEVLVEDSSGGVDTQRFYVFVETEHMPPNTTVLVDPLANVNGWHNSAVKVTLTAIDNQDGSGVKEIHYQVNTNPEAVINGNQVTVNINTQGVTILTYWAMDQAGNQEGPHTLELRIDLSPPLLNIPTLNTTYIYGSQLVFNFSATDVLSGIASISATLNGVSITNGDSVTLTKPGTNTFTLTATDQAGNTSTATNTFEVQYTFSDFLPPVQADGSKVFKLGSTIPIKFQLRDFNNLYISTAIATLTLQQYSNDTPVGDPIIVESTSGADTGNIFRYDFDNEQYIFNLNTKALTQGLWQLQVHLDDGTIKTGFIKLK